MRLSGHTYGQSEANSVYTVIEEPAQGNSFGIKAFSRYGPPTSLSARANSIRQLSPERNNLYASGDVAFGPAHGVVRTVIFRIEIGDEDEEQSPYEEVGAKRADLEN